MRVKVIKESGNFEALLGLGLSFGKTSDIYFDDPSDYYEVEDLMQEVAERLCSQDGGHNKFLESVVVWIDITAPRYWWQEFDTYRVGTTKQSESTIHTIKRKFPLTMEDFEDITLSSLEAINYYIKNGDLHTIKAHLPEGFLQRRVVCTNYKVLRNIFAQRKNHRLKEWHFFIDEIMKQVAHSVYLGDLL